jgi:Mg2+ and Co2+ transporter CorA
MEASKMLAEKAQQSAAKMEVMTEKMHDIAIKTKQETVSMRIITLVTLFFLPGTFISVSYLSPRGLQAQTDSLDRP